MMRALLKWILLNPATRRLLRGPARWGSALDARYDFSQWQASYKNRLIDGGDAVDYDRRYQLYSHLVQYLKLEHAQIDFLEFGVFEGSSFRWWVDHNHHPESRFFGFDSFTGLPEHWHAGAPQGTYSLGGNAPPRPDARSEFVTGLFQQSLQPFLASHHLTRRKVIHIDADLFSATLFVLCTLAPQLRPDDLLLFDEFSDSRHEFRAFQEFVRAFCVKYDVVAGVNGFTQVCLRLTSLA